MRITLAQCRSVAGDIAANVANHAALAADAANAGADLVLFPELSLAGYEPTLAAVLATDVDDARWAPLQRLADERGITIGAGLPRRATGGVAITHAFFRPGDVPLTYSKRFLHPDEEPFFIAGAGHPTLALPAGRITFAICYEISIAAHRAEAMAAGAPLFLASVAKSARGMDAAEETLGALARDHDVAVGIVNCVGPADNFVGAGRTTAWAPGGALVATLDEKTDDLLVFDLPHA